MDQNDADHMFADGIFAYVQQDGDLAAPFVVMTYNNDGWGPTQMHSVIAHEISHVFGASDEYNTDSERPPQCHDAEDCGPQNSYLRTDNGNCEICNPNSVNCYMKRGPSVMCSYTPPELGWRDHWLPNNEVMDPVDQNSGTYMWIAPVAAGDIIRVVTLDMAFKNVFVVSPDQLCGSSHNAVFFEGVDYNDDLMPVGLYVVSKNGSDLGTFYLGSSSASTYSVTAHAFAKDTISFRMPDATLVMRCSVYDSSGALYSRPRFDVMTDHLATVKMDIFGYPDGIYTSKVYGHRSDGAKAQISSLTFVNYTCGDLDGDGLVGQGDLTVLIDHLFITLTPLRHPTAADLDGSGGPITMGDLTALIDHLYISLGPLHCRHSLKDYALQQSVAPNETDEADARAVRERTRNTE